MNESEWNFVEVITSLHSPHELLDNFNLEIVAVTYGSNGAELYVPGKMFVTMGDAKSVIDPVGAGDAFAAALAAGIIQGANLEYTLNIACQTGAEVVQSRGSLVNISEDLRSAFN
jgi:sugar/nucleoside kinase (ribokinase family)